MGMAIVTGRPRKDCEYFLQKHKYVNKGDGGGVHTCQVFVESSAASPQELLVWRACAIGLCCNGSIFHRARWALAEAADVPKTKVVLCEKHNALDVAAHDYFCVLAR